MLGDSGPHLLRWELNLGEEPGSDTEESFLWPLVEPIDAGAVDQSWELSGSETELVAYWGEAKANVEVASNFVKIELPQCRWFIEVAQTLGLIADLA